MIAKLLLSSLVAIAGFIMLSLLLADTRFEKPLASAAIASIGCAFMFILISIWL